MAIIGPTNIHVEDEEAYFAKLETEGEPFTRAKLESMDVGSLRRQLTLKWLHAKDLDRQTTNLAAATDAAAAAKKSARWSVGATVVSIVALAVAVIK